MWKARPEHAEGVGEAKLNGYPEDYSNLIEGLLELYQITFEPYWLEAAQELAETVIEHFSACEGVQEARLRQQPSKATGAASSLAAVALLQDRGPAGRRGWFSDDLVPYPSGPSSVGATLWHISARRARM
jgi:hypothetical protein